MLNFLKTLFKAFQILCTVIVSIILLFIIPELFKKREICKPQAFEVFGKNIKFPITIKEAMNIYKLNYLEYSANSDFKKDTVMFVVADYRYNNWQGNDGTKPPKDSLDFNAHAYAFHIKNPTKQTIENLKIYFEKKFDRKFEDRKFKFNENRYYYMKLDNCTKISLTPNTTLLSDYTNLKIPDVKTCALIIYYNVEEDDVDNGACGNGRMFDKQGL